MRPYSWQFSFVRSKGSSEVPQDGGDVRVEELDLQGLLLIETQRFEDERGWFLEFWNSASLSHPWLPQAFVQDNLAHSKHGVVRGLHFQMPHAQGKFVSVTDGEVFDVAVDLRLDSQTFGQWTAVTLVPARAIYIPEGFAHGYQVVSSTASVLYKCTEYYEPASEHALAWDDPDLRIEWPVADPIVSDKDRNARSLAHTRSVLEKLAAAG